MANGGNGSAAYRAAYNPTANDNTAAAGASRLLRHGNVLDLLRARIKADPRIATREERQHFWSSQMYRDDIDFAHRNRASELLAKSHGDFIERQEIREDVHYHVSWDEDPAEKPKAKRRR